MLSPQQITEALRTGLKMLTAEDIKTPNAWNGDLSALTGICLAILDGRMELVQKEPAGAAGPALVSKPGDKAS